jgi:hypothetical protein
MIKLERLIAHYEKAVEDRCKSKDTAGLDILVATLVHLSAARQAHALLEKLAGVLTVKPKEGG